MTNLTISCTDFNLGYSSSNRIDRQIVVTGLPTVGSAIDRVNVFNLIDDLTQKVF